MTFSSYEQGPEIELQYLKTSLVPMDNIQISWKALGPMRQVLLRVYGREEAEARKLAKEVGGHLKQALPPSMVLQTLTPKGYDPLRQQYEYHLPISVGVENKTAFETIVRECRHLGFRGRLGG